MPSRSDRPGRSSHPSLPPRIPHPPPNILHHLPRRLSFRFLVSVNPHSHGGYSDEDREDWIEGSVFRLLLVSGGLAISMAGGGTEGREERRREEKGGEKW